jgi:hypothetical protein
MPILDSLVEMFKGASPSSTTTPRSAAADDDDDATPTDGPAPTDAPPTDGPAPTDAATQNNDKSNDYLAAKTTHKKDTSSSSDNDTMDSPLRYGDGKRQYCLVEMRRESETGKHLDTFVTLAMADKATNIPRKDIRQGACSVIMKRISCIVSTLVCP